MKTLAIAVLGATFGFGFTANAGLVIGGTIDLTLESKTPGMETEIQLGWYHWDQQAGMYNWTNGITTFCAQLNDSIDVGQAVMYDVVAVQDVPRSYSTIGSGRATLINDLYARWHDYLANDGEGWNDRRAAAFQIVLWEITHETSNGDTAAEILDDLDIEHGYAEFDNDDWVAEYLLASLGGSDGETFLPYGSLVGLTSDYAQDHIAMGSTEPVPGPFGLACGLGIMGLRRRRSRRA